MIFIFHFQSKGAERYLFRYSQVNNYSAGVLQFLLVLSFSVFHATRILSELQKAFDIFLIHWITQ